MTILQVGLSGHGENDNIALALEFLRQALPPNKTGLVVVGTDEKEPLAGRCIRVHCDHGNTRGHRLVNAVFEESGIGNRQ